MAEALLFLADDLKLPEFHTVHATVKFIKTIDTLFDIMNSRLPWKAGIKGPLRVQNENDWRPQVISGIEYLKELKNVNGSYLWKTKRKTPILGFIISLRSVVDIFDAYIKHGNLDYLLTYKFSQDHLELFFCAIRYVYFLTVHNIIRKTLNFTD